MALLDELEPDISTWDKPDIYILGLQIDFAVGALWQIRGPYPPV